MSIIKDKNMSAYVFSLDGEHRCLPCTAFGRSGRAQEQSCGASQTTADAEMSPLTHRFRDAVSQTQMSKWWHSFKNQPLLLLNT